MEFNAKELNDQLLKVQGIEKGNKEVPESLTKVLKGMDSNKLTGSTDKKPEES